ncbi:Protein of unknown function [Gryllus bimaculatus]|nr:Protein of unknown function [Gryllus bimaculatus]
MFAALRRDYELQTASGTHKDKTGAATEEEEKGSCWDKRLRAQFSVLVRQKVWLVMPHAGIETVGRTAIAVTSSIHVLPQQNKNTFPFLFKYLETTTHSEMFKY